MHSFGQQPAWTLSIKGNMIFSSKQHPEDEQIMALKAKCVSSSPNNRKGIKHNLQR
jgi:hypothetical protein